MGLLFQIVLGTIGLLLFALLLAIRESRKESEIEQKILRNQGSDAMMNYRYVRFKAMRP
jgi:hypothetical protein